MGNKLLESIAQRRQEEQMQAGDLFLSGHVVRCVECRTALVGRTKAKHTCDDCAKKMGETTEPESA